MTAQIKADTLLDKMMKGKEIHDIFAENMKKQLLISGKTIDTWEARFKLTIPTDNLSPAMCKVLDLELLDLNQEAAFFYATACAKVQMIRRGLDSSYQDKFFALVQEYKDTGKKLPAAATLETLARVENDSIESAQSIAEVEKGFWQNILEHLSTCRKIVENASYNNNAEAKLIFNANK